MPSNKISSDELRTLFSQAMSDMYRREVPQYGTLLDVVALTNEKVLASNPELRARMQAGGELDRLNVERHGAIRVGTAEELSTIRRVFALMGMYPVGYYDLSVAGVPVHATAFRPIYEDSLANNPFRVFTSLLRLELIEDAGLRETAQRILSSRKIFTVRALELLNEGERRGGFNAELGSQFVQEVLETFRWQGETTVDQATYSALLNAHRLIADIVCFHGPHINHLTPRTLDIDSAQEQMPKSGIKAKETIEGPPLRRHPILLRQTSFKALDEPIRFPGDAHKAVGQHTARFGEIEQRGMA